MDLREAPLHVLYDLTYAYARRVTLYEKEQTDALDKLDRTIRAQQDDFETGLPSFVRQFKAADEV